MTEQPVIDGKALIEGFSEYFVENYLSRTGAPKDVAGPVNEIQEFVGYDRYTGKDTISGNFIDMISPFYLTGSVANFIGKVLGAGSDEVTDMRKDFDEYKKQFGDPVELSTYIDSIVNRENRLDYYDNEGKRIGTIVQKGSPKNIVDFPNTKDEDVSGEILTNGKGLANYLIKNGINIEDYITGNIDFDKLSKEDVKDLAIALRMYDTLENIAYKAVEAGKKLKDGDKQW